MSERRVHCDQKIRFHRQRTFQKTIIRLVTDHSQFRQRIAWTQTFDDAGQEIRLVIENFRVFLDHGGRRPEFKPSRQAQLNYQRRWIHWRAQRGKLQDASVKDDSQGKVWPVATPARDVSARRIRSLPRRSWSFPHCACDTLPIPARAETESAFHPLWLSRTWLNDTGLWGLRQAQGLSKSSLRRGHAEAEQDGQDRKFHRFKITRWRGWRMEDGRWKQKGSAKFLSRQNTLPSRKSKP